MKTLSPEAWTRVHEDVRRAIFMADVMDMMIPAVDAVDAYVRCRDRTNQPTPAFVRADWAAKRALRAAISAIEREEGKAGNG
jgi:hypothetical protein